MSLHHSIQNLKQEMINKNIKPEQGLGDEVFLFASTLMPVVNVDLLIRDNQGRFLLIWRDDGHCGTGWHIPGGCIRFKESYLERAQKTAMREFGHKVLLDPEVIHVFEIFAMEDRLIENQNERAHFITLVMSGTISEDFNIGNQIQKPGKPGYMQWFEDLPDNLLKVQNCYREQWQMIKTKLKG